MTHSFPVTDPILIAVDGPAGSGKGTISRALAQHYGLPYLETGTLYRMVGYMILQEGMLSPTQSQACRVAQQVDISLLHHIDKNVLRDPSVADMASRIAVYLDVRKALYDCQRHFSQQKEGAVLDGRDIGTVIAPDATVKLFVTARPDVRAQRRWKEQEKLPPEKREKLEKTLLRLQERDLRDEERSQAPLIPAQDAILLDTSDLTIEASVHQAISLVDTHIGRTMCPQGLGGKADESGKRGG